MPDKFAVIIPAAGLGARFSSTLPKQYAPLLGQTVLYHSVRTLQRACPQATMVVALHPEDSWFEQVFEQPVRTVVGGQTRAESVVRALEALSEARPEWVLVHDAARPCVSVHDIHLLIERCTSQKQGGLLVAPSQDTLKHIIEGQVHHTVDRETVFRALTPQMFPYELLLKAYQHAFSQGLPVTDEAGAVESLGFKPLAVIGTSQNLKITYPHDLSIAASLLEAQP